MGSGGMGAFGPGPALAGSGAIPPGPPGPPAPPQPQAEPQPQPQPQLWWQQPQLLQQHGVANSFFKPPNRSGVQQHDEQPHPQPHEEPQPHDGAQPQLG